MAQVNTNRIYSARKDAYKNVPEYKRTKALAVNEEKTEPKHIKKTHGTKIETQVRKTKNKAFAFKFIMIAVLCTGMLLFLIGNYAKQYELQVAVSKEEKTITKLNKEYDDINAKIEAELNSKDIENYSINELGYVPKEQLASRVISTERNDTIVISDGNKNENGITIMLSTLYESIRNIFE